MGGWVDVFRKSWGWLSSIGDVVPDKPGLFFTVQPLEPTHFTVDKSLIHYSEESELIHYDIDIR